MADAPDQLRRALEAAVLDGAGHAPAALRRAVAGRDGAVPEELRALVAKIRDGAHRVTDDDVAALSGRYGDDDRFEIVVAAAVGAAFDRLDAALTLLVDT